MVLKDAPGLVLPVTAAAAGRALDVTPSWWPGQAPGARPVPRAIPSGRSAHTVAPTTAICGSCARSAARPRAGRAGLQGPPGAKRLGESQGGVGGSRASLLPLGLDLSEGKAAHLLPVIHRRWVNG